MPQATTRIEDVWAAKGNLADNAVVLDANGKYPALDGSQITSIGDLIAANNLSELTATASTARTNIELGETDTVSFGAFIPPTGTTAEIDAVFSGATAVPDAIYYDREAQIEYQALTSSTRQVVSPSVPAETIFETDVTALNSLADQAFSSDTIDFVLPNLAVGETAVFDIEALLEIIHTAAFFPATELWMDITISEDIGNLGTGFPAFPLEFTVQGSVMASGPTDVASINAADRPTGGFLSDDIKGTFPYAKAPFRLALLVNATTTAGNLMASSKQRITFTRATADFPVSYPVQVSFRVASVAVSPETVTFNKSKIWCKRVDLK